MSKKKEEMEVDNFGIHKKEVEFKSNSRKSKRKEPPEEKKVTKITKGKVTMKKKSLPQRIAGSLVGDDVENVSSYILYDVIIPAAKNLISDTVSGGIEMLLFGQTRGSRTKRSRGTSYVSYNDYYRGTQKPGIRRGTVRPNRRARHNFDDILFETRGEAEEVLSHLVDLTEDYGMATVADMYDLVGVSSDYTDNDYGWDSLGTATVQRARGGYLIVLPKTRLLD